MDQITGWEVETYLEQLEHLRDAKAGQPLAINTVRGHAQVVSCMLKWAERYGIIKQPISFKAPKAPPEEIRYLTEDQQAELIELSDRWTVPNYYGWNQPPNPRNAAFVRFCLETGARQSDALNLNWRDVTWNEEEGDGSAFVRRGKGGKSRTMYFGPDAWEALNKYVEYYNIDQGYDNPVFCSIRNWKSKRKPWPPEPLKPLDRWTSGGIAWVFQSFSKTLGYRVTPHSLRHSWAVNLTLAGIPLRTLQKLGGWANLKLVERYSNLIASDVQDSWRKTMAKSA